MNNEEKILSLLEKMDTRQTQSDQILAQLTSDMSDMKERMDKLDARMNKLDDRMDKLDDRMDKLDARQAKTEITLENVIVPRLDALAEGQKALMETLAPKSRVEALEEEVGMLKSVIRILSNDVAELKKAQ